MMKSLQEYLEETIRRYGAAGHSPAMGNTLEEAATCDECGYPMESCSCDEETVDEGRMGEIDIEHQDYEKLSPLAFRNRYHKSKEDWYDQHKSLLEPKKQSQDKAHWDFGRILELAGVADHKFNKDDSAYCEDQDAAVVAQKELENEITDPMPGVHENRKN